MIQRIIRWVCMARKRSAFYGGLVAQPGGPAARAARRQMQGHFVDAAGMERMAAGDAPKRQPAAAPGAVPLDRLQRVLRTGGQESAARSEKRADRRRSEERRVGKECRSRWWPDHEKKRVEEG